MGLFEDLGRRVERLKQEAKEASQEQAEYVCADCDTLVYGGRDDCPECGAASLRSLTDTEAAAAKTSAMEPAADDTSDQTDETPDQTDETPDQTDETPDRAGESPGPADDDDTPTDNKPTQAMESPAEPADDGTADDTPTDETMDQTSGSSADETGFQWVGERDEGTGDEPTDTDGETPTDAADGRR